MANADQQPWAPDPDNAVGTAPSNGYTGTGGERGTSVFDGSTKFDTYGVPIGTNPVTHYPRKGDDYAVASGTDTKVASTTTSGAGRTTAGTIAKLTPTNVVTASSLSPVHDVAVLLTATLGSVADWKVTGTVTFKDGATTLGTGTINGSEVATYNVTAGFSTGAHVITAVYGGDTHFTTLTSASITVTAS